MECSLNEIQTLGLKAARGAGLSWGLAQEAGWAVRWLEDRELDGGTALARLLELLVDQDTAAFGPDTSQLPWRAGGGSLSGLHAGVAFVDLAGAIEPQGELELQEVAEPLLMLPFAASASQVCGWPLEVRWGGNQKLLSGGEVMGAVSLVTEVQVAPVVTVRVVNAAPLSADEKRQTEGVPVDDDVLARLNEFARRTYVPESDASRTKGAGAGNIDND